MFNLYFSEFRVQTGLVNPGKVQTTAVPAEGGNSWRGSESEVEEIWVSFFMPDQEDCLDISLGSWWVHGKKVI